MSADPLLRYYRSDEMFDSEGYPLPWRHESQAPPEFQTGLPNDGPIICPRIPDLIREMRGHRCERCGHPYEKGNPNISERAEWSPCDGQCVHVGPMRYRPANGEEQEWRVSDPGDSVGPIRDWLFDYAPEGRLIPRWEVEAQWRILTVHHLDSDKANCRWWNLVALCQRCHLRMQRAVIMDREYHFEHSEWFKPYAAGFYAFKYEGRDILREEAEFRLDHFLRYEHRFTQEAIF